MVKVVIYSKASCPYCDMAKALLTARHQAYEEIRIDQDASKADEMIRLTHRRSVPQIIINDQPIGGYDELAALAKSGKLDGLLK